jgi:superfamily II DNA helicase RecQ
LDVLRQHFPAVPIIALTATATPQIQDDIIDVLQLRVPVIVKASFNRPNLHYTVKAKTSQTNAEIGRFIVKSYKNASGIVY